MKILQFVPYHLPYPGGQERYVHNLSKYLVKMGHDVDIITSNFPKSKKRERIDGIDILRYKCIARLLRNPITPKFFAIGKKIKKYEIIHTHNEHSSSAIAAAYYRRKYGTPLIITCHGQLVFGDTFRDVFEKVYSKTFGRGIVLTSCDEIIVNSTDDKDYILSLDNNFSEKTTVLHNAIDPEFLDSIDVDKIDLEGDLNILYVGRLIKRKGVDFLIKSVNIIKEMKKINCLLVGEGEDQKYFKKLVHDYDLGDCVKFLGKISDKELIALYKSSDVFVLPSLSEVCPTVALEAMYFGLPVITTNIAGIKDHFKDVALLVPPKDEYKLADAIIRLIEDGKLRGDLSKSGQRLIKKKYLWDTVANNYEKIYVRNLV